MPVKLSAPTSLTLHEILVQLSKNHRVVVKDDTWSSWIELDIYSASGGLVRFAIWKATDALYMLDSMGAAEDDPIAIATAMRHIRKR